MKPAGQTIAKIYVLFFFLLSGCDDVFDITEENDQYIFSVYGYLDASADTQWVRVMPVRQGPLDISKPIDATVTLEHIESGETVVMNDSLMSFEHETYAWNFWTTMELQPEQTYRLKAERTDGKYSAASVTLPEDFPAPRVHISYDYLFWPALVPELTTVFIEGVEKLADIQTVYHVHTTQDDTDHIIGLPHLENSIRTVSPFEGYEVSIDPEQDYGYLNTFYRLNPPVQIEDYIQASSPYNPKIFIAAAGPDFDDFITIDEQIINLPEGVTNIEHGVGYLAGIVSKTIPYLSCTEEGSARIIPCDPEPSPW